MKLTVERDALVSAVAFAVRAVSKNNPILSGIMLEADMESATLHISGFDGETSAEASIEAEIGEPGKILVNGLILAGICKELPKKPVEIIYEDRKITLSCGSSKFNLARLPVEDYPTLPLVPDAIGTVESASFASAVDRVAVAAATDPKIVMKLTCVYVSFYGTGEFSMCATDRYRLTVDDGIWEAANPDQDVLVVVPAKSLLAAAKSMTGEVSLYANAVEGQATVFALGDSKYTITCRLIEEEVIAWAAILPKESPIQIILDTVDLTSAVRRVSVVNEEEKPIRLSVLNDELFIESTAGENAGSSTVPIESGNMPADFSIGFNPKYFIEALSTIETGRVLLKFTVPRKPCIMAPIDEDGNELEGFIHFVMPQIVR